MRLLAVENCIKIGQLMSHQEAVQHLLPVIISSCKDKSWRVRYMAADKIIEVSD